MMEFFLYFLIDSSKGDLVYDAAHHSFPIFQFSRYCAFLPIAFLTLNQCAVYKFASSLSFSAISCGFFRLLPPVTWQLCHFQRAPSFYGEIFAIRSEATVWCGHGTHFLRSCSSSFVRVLVKAFDFHEAPSSYWLQGTGGRRWGERGCLYFCLVPSGSQSDLIWCWASVKLFMFSRENSGLVARPVGWSATPVCLGLRTHPGCRTFGAKTETILGKLDNWLPYWPATSCQDVLIFLIRHNGTSWNTCQILPSHWTVHR